MKEYGHSVWMRLSVIRSGIAAGGIVLAFLVGLSGLEAAWAEPGLTPGQMRTLGFELLAAGHTDQALAVADLLLQRDPEDPAALALRARGLRDTGQDRAARQAAATAWAAAETPRERFDAALVRAQVLSSAGNRTAAQFWLRRAVQAAPTAQERAIAERDFRYVRSRNPLQLNLSLGVAPSSNVNNGSQHQTIDGFGMVGTLSPDAQALSGWTAQVALAARLRLASSAISTTWARFAVTRREVRLSSNARNRLDTWVADQAAAGRVVTPRRNFNFGAVEAGIGHRRAIGPATISIDATLGRNWYGGARLSDYLRTNFVAERRLGTRQAVYGKAVLERQWRHDSRLRNADLGTVEGGIVHALPGGDRLRLGFGARRVNSFSPDIRHGAVLARLGWDKAEPVAGIGLAANLTMERRRYDPSLLAPVGRRDLRLDAGLTLTFENVSYMGFVPMLDLHVSRFRSNVGLFDGRDAGVALGVRSLF